MRKAEVRRVAEAAGLPSAARRSSAGICFIGVLPHSPHQDFLEEHSIFVTCLQPVHVMVDWGSDPLPTHVYSVSVSVLWGF